MRIDEKKVHCAVCRVAVFTLKDTAEKDAAFVMSSSGCAAKWTGGDGLMAGRWRVYFLCHVYSENLIVLAV